MNKNLTTLETVFNRVDAMAANHFDHFINVRDLSFDNLETVKIAGNAHPMKEIAQRSMAWRLGIPYNYLAKCPPEIQALNMNHWLQHEKNTQLFFRFDGREVRAIFTPKYKPVDNMDLILEIYAMGYRPETQVQCHLDETFMSLSIMDGEKSFDINGDRFRPGVSISNSEVGIASLSISAFILRLVCTNGMISKTQLSASYRHVSSKILVEMPKILEQVSVELGEQRRQIGISMESPVRDPLGSIESFNRRFGIPKKEAEAVKLAWEAEPGETMFAVINAYTRAARVPELTAEEAYRLEKTGGMILSLVKH